MTRATFIIGLGDNVSKAMQKKAAALTETADKFGGVTIRDARGGWLDPSGNLETEPSLEIMVLTDKHVHEIRKHAISLARLFGENAVTVTTETVELVMECSTEQCSRV